MKNKNIFRLTGIFCSFTTAFVGLIAIAGWFLNIPLLTRIRVEYIPMAPSTALSFILLGSSLFASIFWSSHKIGIWYSRAVSYTVIVFVFLIIAQFMTGFDFKIEEFLLKTSETLDNVPVGRMSPVTASAFFLSGLVLLILNIRIKEQIFWNLAFVMATGVFSIGFIITSGYITGMPFLYGGDIIPVAITTAVAFVLLGTGLLSVVSPYFFHLYSEISILHGKKRRFIKLYFPAVVVLITGIIITVVMAVIVQKQEQKIFADKFIQKANNIVLNLQRRIDKNLEVLYGTRSFFEASRLVERDEFRIFLSMFLKHHPGIQAVEWIPRVSDSKRLKYESEAKKDGLNNFEFTELSDNGSIIKAGKRMEYYPVYFAEPVKGNENVIGFDLGSHNDRLKALEKARDTGEMSATSRVKLVQEKGEQLGFLVFLPVYKKDVLLNSTEERRKHILGFILGVFRIEDVIKTSIDGIDYSDVEIMLSDPELKPEKRQLYSAGRSNLKGVNKEYYKTVFAVADRIWEVEISQTHSSCYGIRSAFGIFGAGLLFTTLLITYMIALEKYTVELESSKEEKEKLIEKLKDAIADVKVLSGMLPICSACKKIRNDTGYWETVEVYIRDHSEAEFSHGLCPECAKNAYEELDKIRS